MRSYVNWVEVGFQLLTVAVELLTAVLLYLFLQEQQKVESGERKKNSYDWVIRTGFWACTIGAALWLILLPFGIHSAFKMGNELDAAIENVDSFIDQFKKKKK